MLTRHFAWILAISVLFGGIACAGSIAIEQSGQEFSQSSAEIKTGDTVIWTNHDDVTHNINIINEDDDAKDMGLQKPGEIIKFMFDKAGRFKVRCSIHPSMKMTVIVS